MADQYATLYRTAKTLVAVWTAQGLAANCPNTVDTVADGSDVDGRGRITGQVANGAITQAQAFVADLEANSNAKLNAIMVIAVNPRG